MMYSPLSSMSYALICIIGELPVTIDFILFERNPGDHNITIVAYSAMGEMTNITYKFRVPGIIKIYVAKNVT